MTISISSGTALVGLMLLSVSSIIDLLEDAIAAALLLVLYNTTKSRIGCQWEARSSAFPRANDENNQKKKKEHTPWVSSRL